MQLNLFVIFAQILSILEARKLPVVYVYTVIPSVCKRGLPSYIAVSLEQAVLSQPDADIILASNLNECEHIRGAIAKIRGLKSIDASVLASNRTRAFAAVASNMFQSGHDGLWITSALRFFMMEDVMIAHGYEEIFHVEADNMLYGNITQILPILRTGYPALAATPLTAEKVLTTASVFWIANLRSLITFNDYLLRLGASNMTGDWGNYLRWLRPYACCKHGGVDQVNNCRRVNISYQTGRQF